MTISLTGSGVVFGDGTQAVAAKAIQVAQTAKTSAFTMVSSAWTDVTGLSVTITPKSTSSKIYIYVSATVGSSDYGVGTVYGKFLRVTRNGTVIGQGDARGSNTQALCGSAHCYSANYPTPSYGSWVDSPASTAAQTYQVQIKNETNQLTTIIGGSYSSGTAYCTSSLSTITVIEVL